MAYFWTTIWLLYSTFLVALLSLFTNFDNWKKLESKACSRPHCLQRSFNKSLLLHIIGQVAYTQSLHIRHCAKEEGAVKCLTKALTKIYWLLNVRAMEKKRNYRWMAAEVINWLDWVRLIYWKKLIWEYWFFPTIVKKVSLEVL